MIQLDEILSTAIIRLEQTEQVQWKKINELEQQNMILQDENMHLKDYLAEATEENRKLQARLNPNPCLTNRPKGVNNGS